MSLITGLLWWRFYCWVYPSRTAVFTYDHQPPRSRGKRSPGSGASIGQWEQFVPYRRGRVSAPCRPFILALTSAWTIVLSSPCVCPNVLQTGYLRSRFADLKCKRQSSFLSAIYRLFSFHVMVGRVFGEECTRRVTCIDRTHSPNSFR